MQLSDGLAVAAIVLALFTILLGILFYKWQSDLAKEMHGLLSKIEGLTTSTREQVQEREKQLLDFALGQQQGWIGEELEKRVAGIEERVAGLGGGLSREAKQQLDSLMAQLKREVETLANDVKALAKSARSQPPPAAPQGGETPFLDQLLQKKTLGGLPFLDRAQQEAMYQRWLRSLSRDPAEGAPET